MWFAVITLFPEMLSALTDYGITSRAIKEKKMTVVGINPRDFTTDNYRRVDNRPFGGGAGMVMMAEPLKKAIDHAKLLAKQAGVKNAPVVYLSPQGMQLNEGIVQSFSNTTDGAILLCGRYDGVDERLLKCCVDMELSIGDYVLSGGELAAMVLMDAMIRKLPDVMGDNHSPIADSFVDGLLDYPQYTKPDVFMGEQVPDVLKSGNHAVIAKWRFLQQYKRTSERRADLAKAFEPSELQQTWLDECD